ncbi:MAG: hypothetical protein ABI595_04825 [Actinomycetota bacterium]
MARLTTTFVVRRLVAPLSVALVSLTLFIAPAVADVSKPYAAVMSPGNVPAGSTSTFTATLTNETSTQQLGSANLTLPAGFSPLSVGIPSPSGTATIAGNTIQLRGLAAPAGTSASVSVVALSPCPLGTYIWSVIAKQANNFSGDPGNDLTFDAANSSLTTTLTGSCHLGFDFVSQPASAQVNAAITTVTYDPAATPVAVQILDGSGSLIASSTAPVTLTILNNPGGGVLSGATTVNAVGGIAAFPGIKIDRSGLNYTLSAGTAAVAIDPAVSAPFNIADVGKQCSTGPCASGTVTEGGTSASELASGGSVGDLLSLFVSVEALDCANYTETSAVVTFDVTGSRTKSVTITTLKSSSPKPSKIRVCFGSPTAFVDRSGATVNLGLLPDCSVSVAPCVASVRVVKGNIVTTFQAPAGDPKGRV